MSKPFDWRKAYQKQHGPLPWTGEADRLLLQWSATGEPLAVAARRLDRSPGECLARLAELRAAAAPAAAEAAKPVQDSQAKTDVDAAPRRGAAPLAKASAEAAGPAESVSRPAAGRTAAASSPAVDQSPPPAGASHVEAVGDEPPPRMVEIAPHVFVNERSAVALGFLSKRDR